MGILGLSKFIKDRLEPKTTHLSKIRSKFGIDVSNLLCRYKATNPQSLIQSLYRLILSIRKNGGCAVFIYDGQSTIDKKDEVERRKAIRQGMQDKIETVRKALSDYLSPSKKMDPCLKALQETNIIKDRFKDVPDMLDINFVNKKLIAMQKQIVRVTEEDIQATKDLLEAFGIIPVQAPMECDHAAKVLFDRGEICALYSQDSDTIAYGVDWITDYDMKTGDITYYEYADVLQALQFTSSQFTDFCIMCGCDYNKRIRLLGPQTAYKLIKEHESIENVEKTGIDITTLKHQRVRDFFSGAVCGDCTSTYWWPVKLYIPQIIDVMRNNKAFADIDELVEIWKPAEIKEIDKFE